MQPRLSYQNNVGLQGLNRCPQLIQLVAQTGNGSRRSKRGDQVRTRTMGFQTHTDTHNNRQENLSYVLILHLLCRFSAEMSWVLVTRFWTRATDC